ncbi:MAG: phosphoenolpyruvate carboxykinase (ATP), partial [Candidatus Gastranaerophilales bacterium]|nr:phosphoenolpyruvate carboxykinase (ATP) [Candidatus Gastranaerophilales bacterium]
MTIRVNCANFSQQRIGFSKSQVSNKNNTANLTSFTSADSSEMLKGLKGANLSYYVPSKNANVFNNLNTRATAYANEIMLTAGSDNVKKLSKAELLEKSILIGESVKTKDGALSMMTGEHTGRSPNAKFFVKTPNTNNKINWSNDNMGISQENADKIYAKIKEHLAGKEVYLVEAKAGASENATVPITFINTSPAQAFFEKNMFIEPTGKEKEFFNPKFTVIAAPELEFENPEEYGLKSKAAVIINPDKGLILIAGTKYSGEIKKSVFSAINYLAPQKDILPMHCSANVGKDGDSLLIFGLSGTGKTTLSADPNRPLIGDDEHLWSNTGIANLEGGCYAK